MASGRLTTAKVDIIAEAAEKSDGAAALDEELITAIANAGVDAGRKIAAEWLLQRADKDKTRSEYERQRSLRAVRRYVDPNKGTHVVKLEGDSVSIDEFYRRLELRERDLYEADGGKDLPNNKHRRTYQQRMFDAAMELLEGAGSAGGSAADSTGSGSGSGSAGVGRPAAVINFDGNDPDAGAEMVGVGPITDEVAVGFLRRANVFVNIRDVTGTPMWFGRLRRTGSLDQFIALAARDKGCGLCGAHWLNCQMHHLMPFNAAGKGETNVDEMMLVCQSCHTDVHAHKLTIVRAANGTWTTRPALPHEIAPNGPTGRNGPSGPSGSKSANPKRSATRRPTVVSETGAGSGPASAGPSPAEGVGTSDIAAAAGRTRRSGTARTTSSTGKTSKASTDRDADDEPADDEAAA